MTLAVNPAMLVWNGQVTAPGVVASREEPSAKNVERSEASTASRESSLNGRAVRRTPPAPQAVAPQALN